MQVLLPELGLGALSLASLAVAGLFGRGGSDDADLSGIARRLDAREDPTAIERKLDRLEDAVNTLAGDADVERALRNPPAADAVSVEKARALSQAVERGELSIQPGGGGRSGSGGDSGGSARSSPVAGAAARLEGDLSPASPAARELLSAVAAPDRATAADAEDALRAAVEALDAQHELDRALDALDESADADADANANAARRVKRDLERAPGETTERVRRLAAIAERGQSAGDRRADERDEIASAADRVTAGVAESSDLDVGPDSGRSTAERLHVLADAVERGDLGDGDDETAAAVAAEVRRARNPESAIAKRLLDRLASPSGGDLRGTLRTTVRQLDEATTTQSIVGDLDRDSVRSLADDVASRVEEVGGPAAELVGQRVADLRGMVERADDANAVVPYAVRQELRFYDRSLVPELAGGSGDAASAEVPLDDLADRRAEVEDRYVDGRRDHNHTIPLHFLSLVDDLREEAERRAATGREAEAAGVLSAAEETLAHVEQLYERNEYSVMLRRLRG